MKYILIFSLGFLLGYSISSSKEKVIELQIPKYHKYVKDGVTVKAAEAQGKTIVYQKY